MEEEPCRRAEDKNDHSSAGLWGAHHLADSVKCAVDVTGNGRAAQHEAAAVEVAEIRLHMHEDALAAGLFGEFNVHDHAQGQAVGVEPGFAVAHNLAKAVAHVQGHAGGQFAFAAHLVFELGGDVGGQRVAVDGEIVAAAGQRFHAHRQVKLILAQERDMARCQQIGRHITARCE